MKFEAVPDEYLLNLFHIETIEAKAHNYGSADYRDVIQ